MVIKDETAYCMICNKYLKYGIRVTPAAFEINGECHIYNKYEAFCPICKNEVYVQWVKDMDTQSQKMIIKKG